MDRTGKDDLLPGAGEIGVHVDQMLFAVVRATLVAIPLGLVFALLGSPRPSQLAILCTAQAYATGLFLLLRRGHSTLCVYAIVFGLIALSAALAATYGSIRGVGTMALVVAITIGGIFLERRALIAATALGVSSLGILAYAQNAGWLPIPDLRVTTSYWAMYGIIITTVALVLSYMRSVLLEVFQRLQSELKERRKAEAAGLQSEMRFRKAFESSPVGMTITRVADGRYLEVNLADEETLGYSRHELIGRTVLEMGAWLSVEDRESFLAVLRAEKGVRAHDIRMRNKAGAIVDCRVWANLVEIDGEECVLSSIVNLTGQQRTEGELRSSRRLLENVIDAIPMSIFAKDLDSNYVMVNKAMAELFGLPKDALLGRHTSHLPTPEAVLVESLQADAWVLKNARTLDQPDRIVTRPDGTLIPYHNTKIPLFDEAGKVTGLLGINRDVSEEKRAREALAESEQRFRAIFESSKAGIATWALDGRFLTVNNAFCEFVGYSADELVGRMSAGDLRQPGEDQELNLTGRMMRGEIPHITRDRRYKRRDASTVWGRTTVAGVTGNDGAPQYFVAVVIDVTEARDAREHIERINAELDLRVQERTAELRGAVANLEEANRDLDSFNYSIAHDLRQPLNAIGGFSDLLREPLACASPGEVLECAREIETNARHMEQMIEALLRFSNFGRGELNTAQVDMKHEAESVLRNLAGNAPLRAEVTIGDLPAAPGDRALLRHIWSNLIGNALKYSARSPAPSVEISGSRLGNVLEYSVRDNGVGFDMRHAEDLFGVFQRLPTSAGFEGTGVGLAIVQRIVRRHGGQIRAESAPGKGATFRFTLPVWPRESALRAA